MLITRNVLDADWLLSPSVYHKWQHYVIHQLFTQLTGKVIGYQRYGIATIKSVLCGLCERIRVVHFNPITSRCHKIIQFVSCRPSRSLLGTSRTSSTSRPTTGWLRIKYPTRQYAISPHSVAWFQKFLKLLNPDTSVNLTLYNVSTAP